MDSSTHRLEAERQKQAEIKRQIAFLQAQLTELPVPEPTPAPTSPSAKRKHTEPTLLVPATPSPKKKRKLDTHAPPNPNPNATRHARKSINPSSSSAKHNPKPDASGTLKPPPSNVLAKLASLSASAVDAGSIEEEEGVQRSTGFVEPPPATTTTRRDERLQLIEDLEPGPYEHTPPTDDPLFEKLEPNSGIRMSTRTLSHEDLQSYLYGRFYLSPSRLYSSIRLLPDKQGYDVPVPGDWVTIAVVAERGEMKFTKAPVGIGKEGEEKEKKGAGHWKRRTNGAEELGEEPPAKFGKKYVNLKLIDFGARSSSTSSSTSTGTKTIRGDAFLSLLLFEADGFDTLVAHPGARPEKVYRGGSRGAFEKLASVKEGDVVMLLNPKILKPFQRSSSTPHPTTNILALTPTAASSIVVIGRSRDLGMCTVVKKDGKVCGSWVDKRTGSGEVCEYHVQSAVGRARAGRAEFSIGTTGLTTTSKPNKSNKSFDPSKQWGLRPPSPSSQGLSTSSSSTYILSGHIVSSSASTIYATESIGREGQAKAKRKMEARENEMVLKRLLERDRDGMKAVVKAREFAIEEKSKAKEKGKGKESDGKEKVKEAKVWDDAKQQSTAGTSKSAYNAELVKRLGFDPSFKPGMRRVDNAATQRKLEKLKEIQASRKEITSLGPKPGPRIRSGVRHPEEKGGRLWDSSESTSSKSKKAMDGLEVSMSSIENDDEVLPALDEVLSGRPGNLDSDGVSNEEGGVKMVDLDDF